MKLLLENLFTEEQIHDAICFGIKETHRLYKENLDDIEDERIDDFLKSLKEQKIKIAFPDSENHEVTYEEYS